MKTLIFILILAAAALAQGSNSPTLAYCETGKGCTFCQSAYSYDDIDSMLGYLGTYKSEKGVMTFFRNKEGEQRHYPERKRSRSQLHEYFGGKGEPAASANCPMAFPGIQPRDGNWTIRTEKPISKNCPAGTAEQLDKITLFGSGPKTFSKPFVPTDLLSVQEIKWISLGPNEYRGVFDGAIGSFNTIYDVTVQSPESMTGSLSAEIKIPGQPVCSIRKTFNYTRTGD